MLVSIFALIAEEASATQSVLHSPASNKASIAMAPTSIVDQSLTTTEGDAPPTRSLSVATGLEPLSPSRGRKRKRNRSKRKKTEEALRTAAARDRESSERAFEAGARVHVIHSGGGAEKEEREKEVRVVAKRSKKEATSGLVNVKPQSIELKTEVVAVVEMSVKHANDSAEAPQVDGNGQRGGEGDKRSNGTEQRGGQHSQQQHPHSKAPTATNATLLEQLLLRSSDLSIGAAMYDITGPAAEVGMFGYAKAGQLTSGIHMRLRARAFAFHHVATDKHCVYVVADVGMISEWVRQAVLSRLAKHAKLASSGDAAAIYLLENVMISATHTHCSPGGLSHYFIYSMHPPLRGADRQNFECVVDGIVEAIVRAHSNLQPAFIRVAKGNCLGASVNRSEDAYMANPREEREKYEHDTDKEMTLWRFDGVNGYPIGMINWFAVHPTSMGNWYTLITGDNKV